MPLVRPGRPGHHADRTLSLLRSADGVIELCEGDLTTQDNGLMIVVMECPAMDGEKTTSTGGRSGLLSHVPGVQGELKSERAFASQCIGQGAYPANKVNGDG